MDHRHATTNTTHNYRAFLLRLWREDSAAPWRCSLQATDAVERLGFADLYQLATYLLDLANEVGMQLPGPPASELPDRPLEMAWPARTQHTTTLDGIIVPQTDGE